MLLVGRIRSNFIILALFSIFYNKCVFLNIKNMIKKPNETKTKHSQEEKKRFLFSRPWNSYPGFPLMGSTRVIHRLLKFVTEDCVLLLLSQSLRQGGWDYGDWLNTLGAGMVTWASWVEHLRARQDRALPSPPPVCPVPPPPISTPAQSLR